MKRPPFPGFKTVNLRQPKRHVAAMGHRSRSHIENALAVRAAVPVKERCSIHKSGAVVGGEAVPHGNASQLGVAVSDSVQETEGDHHANGHVLQGQKRHERHQQGVPVYVQHSPPKEHPREAHVNEVAKADGTKPENS